MKTLIKLVLVAVVLNAAFRGASAAWDYYRIKDETERILTFGSSMRPSQLRAGILSAAADLGVPLRPEALTISRDGVVTTARGSYETSVEYFPTYQYPLSLSFVVEVVSLNPGPVDD